VVPLSSVSVEARASGCDSGSLDGRKETAAHPCIVLPPELSSPALIDRHYALRDASRAANTVCGPDWSRVAVRSGPFRRGHIAIGRTGGGHRQPRHRASPIAARVTYCPPPVASAFGSFRNLVPAFDSSRSFYTLLHNIGFNGCNEIVAILSTRIQRHPKTERFLTSCALGSF
jgi:hypothetical protein